MSVAPRITPAAAPPNLQRLAQENGVMRRQLAVLQENDRLKTALAGRGVPAPQARPTMRAIAEDVALAHDVSLSALVGPGRTREVVRARWEAMWLCRRVGDADGRPRWSLPRIGRFFNRDHTTVVHALRCHEKILAAAQEGVSA